jgi:hypothetical protein
MRRTWGIVLVGLAVLAGAGCSDGDQRASGDDATAMDGAEIAGGVVATTIAAFDSDESARMATESGGGGSAGVSLDALPDLGARVVRTAELRIEVDKGTFAERLRTASSLARMLGGFVESSSTSSFEEGDASGEITLRVPVERYDDAMSQLAELGTLEASSEEGEDVTDRLVDLDARLRALRAEEDALNALMAEAANVNEVLSIRSTATGIRQQIEELAAQQASLEKRSSYSTIHVLLHEATAELASASGTDEWGLGDAFETAVDAAEAIVGSAIVAVGVAVPVLPLALVAWLVVRRRRRAVTVLPAER